MEGKFTLLIVLVACATLVRASVESVCDGEDNGVLLPHPDDCAKFFVCIQGIAYEQECHPGYYFDAKKKVCLPEQVAQCDIKLVAVKYTLAFRAADDDLVEACKGKPNGALVAHPHDCTKFLYCLATPVVRDCPSGLHFNPKLKVCDWPANAGCTVKPTDPKKPCEGKPDGTVLPDLTDDTMYIVCTNSEGRSYPCGAYSVKNDKTGKFDVFPIRNCGKH